MVYRAKITSILSWVQSQYDTNRHHIVSDARDKYIEVSNEDEAEQLENMNACATTLAKYIEQ